MRDKLRSLEGARTPAGRGPVIVRR
jgi:hypothetical protein